MQFLSNLQAMGDVEYEIVRLSEYQLEMCRGCKLCCDKGEEYYAQLEQGAFPAPSWMKLMLFRLGRTKMKLELDDSYRDYRYYADKGWFESGFYYRARLGLLKRGAGSFFDWMSAQLTKAR